MGDKLALSRPDGMLLAVGALAGASRYVRVSFDGSAVLAWTERPPYLCRLVGQADR